MKMAHILIYFINQQIAVCNLASIAVNMFVKADKSYDFPKLKEITKVVTKNLNKVIEINYYPVQEVCILYSQKVNKIKNIAVRSAGFSLTL